MPWRRISVIRTRQAALATATWKALVHLWSLSAMRWTWSSTKLVGSNRNSVELCAASSIIVISVFCAFYLSMITQDCLLFVSRNNVQSKTKIIHVSHTIMWRLVRIRSQNVQRWFLSDEDQKSTMGFQPSSLFQPPVSSLWSKPTCIHFSSGLFRVLLCSRSTQAQFHNLDLEIRQYEKAHVFQFKSKDPRLRDSNRFFIIHRTCELFSFELASFEEVILDHQGHQRCSDATSLVGVHLLLLFNKHITQLVNNLWIKSR